MENKIKELTNEKVVEIVRELIEKHTSLKTEDYGAYSGDIYVDYMDELSDKTIREIALSNCPKDAFYDQFDIIDWEWKEEEEVLSIVKDYWDENEYGDYGIYEDDIREWVDEQVYFNFPYDHFLKQKINVNIVVDTGDGNYDFTLNNFAGYDAIKNENIDEESSILWLVKQQGYDKKQLSSAISEQDFNNSKFLETVFEESVNISTHMNALTFFVEMSLGEYFDYLESPIDMKLEARVNCGLCDFWNGGGSLLGIELEKEIVIPEKYIQIHVDGNRGYGVDGIYGMMDSFWTDSLM